MAHWSYDTIRWALERRERELEKRIRASILREVATKNEQPRRRKGGRPRVEQAYPDEIEAIRRIRAEHPGLTDDQIIDIAVERTKLSPKQVRLRLKRAKLP